MTQKEIIQKLNKATSNYNFVYIIAAIVLNDFCGSFENLNKKDFWKQLNYSELAFLVGLWIKNASKTQALNIDVQADYKEINLTMEDLHNSFLKEGPKISDQKAIPSDFLINGHHFKEAFFYSSTGGYDYQFAENCIVKYRYDEKWIKEKKAINLQTLPYYFRHVKKCLQKHLNDPRLKNQRFITNDDVLNIFCLSDKELFNQNPEFEKITALFSIEPGAGSAKDLNEIGDFNEFLANPIVKLAPQKYFIPLPFFLAEAIYESPFYWMVEDTSYRGLAMNNRGVVAEEIVSKHFAEVFGHSNTFNGVKIKENKTTTESDIDVVGIVGDSAIIAQVKSKKLTTISKKGNIEKIKDDFKKAVEDAFVQGVTCKKCIENAGNFDFITRDGRKINNRIIGLKNVYIICVVIDSYPALTHLSHQLLYKKYNEGSICLTAFDLEILCWFLKKPDQLINYISKRIQTNGYFYGDNELCYLGFYLQHGLTQKSGYTNELIDNRFGSVIDRSYYPKIAGYTKTFATIKKVGRNDVCPCGSGDKYKFCHGKGS